MPLTKSIQDFVKWKGTHSKRAVEPYDLWLKRFNSFTRKPIETIEIEDVTRFSEWVTSKYSPNTHYYMMTILHVFFNYQNRRGKGMLSDLIVTKRVKANSHLAAREDEFNAILQTFDTNDFLGLRNLVMVKMPGECGMRVSELTDLNISNIDLKERLAIIRTKKTQKERRIVWSEYTNTLLAEYIGRRATLERGEALFIGFDPNMHVTGRITSRSVQRIIKTACKHAGIDRKISPHSFRHYWAIDKRRKGAAISFVQAGLGHSSPITTIDTYEKYGVDEFVDEARRYLDHQETRVYTPLIRKLEEEEKIKEQLIKKIFSKNSQ